MISSALNWRLVPLMLILLFIWCAARGQTLAAPATQLPGSQDWRVNITRMVTEDDGKIAVKFIATVTNIGKEEQVLFTPGVVGPVFWPRTPFKGEPLETHVAPRPEGDSSKDFVWLRPGEGFSRISDSFDEAQLRSLSSVGANLMLYEKGFEGRSDKVATVIEAKQYKIEEPTPEGKEPR